MNVKRKIAGVGTIVGIFVALTAFQLQAQTPTATVTPTPVLVSTTPPPIALLSTRQAVVKTPKDGDSVEVVFTDNGQVATVHLASIKAPNLTGEIECFGREAAEYAVQSYQKNPLISIEPAGEIENNEVAGYITLADGTLLNEILVLFGYARYDKGRSDVYTERIQTAEQQSKKGNTGLWRVCGEPEQPPQPCFLFARGEIDSASKREFFAEYPDARELHVWFRNATYDPIQNQIAVLWSLSINGLDSGWRMKEFYRLSDCLRDRSEVFNNRDNH
ncbi:MAG: thermonuclease family protein [Chloroflexi bacterium]|nr:thermonuclease family protein [Chloroflexota bacterium]